MRIQYRVTVCAGVFAAWICLAARAAADGSLDPTNAPGPTMHTLEEIHQKVAAVETAVTNSARNCMAANIQTGDLAVWDAETGSWSDTALGGGLAGSLRESEGNFCAISTNGNAAAWSRITKAWSHIALGYRGYDVRGSQGNFVAISTSGTVAAWNQETQTWTVHVLPAGSCWATGSDD